MIYHIVPEKDYQSNNDGNKYEPISLFTNGFIHCSLEHSVIPVANDYYGNGEEKLLLLRIEPGKLTSETKYEAALPDKDVNTSHLSSSTLFPHVYGPIDNSAVDGIAILAKNTCGYTWPDTFISLDAYFGKKEK